MARYRHIIAIIALAVLVPSVSFAQGKKKPNAASATETELATLRTLVEDQSRQIQTLTEQVAHLALLIETSHPAAVATPAPAPQAPAPVIRPEAPVQQEALTPGAADTPGAHVVTKGETLTSIAKHYKITVGDLLKVNKIANDRMLQIGQTLVIPIPTPAADNPQEKKENQ